ncbi:MAG: hypothetical protein K8F91_26455, partial [Candidatus Obscuribacterales bacterium]|nr:hypothetical protein [Candidatus Obscuribacterales bacterium]
GMSAEDILVWSGAARNILEAVAILKGQNVPGGNGWPGGGRNQPWQSGQVWNQPGWNQGPSWNGSWDGNYPYDPGGYYPGGNNRGIVYNGNGDMSTRSSEMNFPGGSVYKDKTVVGGNAGRGSDYGHGQGHGHDGQGGITSEDILVGSGAVRNVLEGVAILKGRHPGANNGYFGNGGQQFSNNQARSYYDMQNLAQTSPDYRIRQRAAQQVARWQQRGMG